MEFGSVWRSNYSHSQEINSSRWLGRIASATGLAIAGLALSLSVHAQSGGQSIEGIFTNVNSAPDWTISGSRYGSAMNPSVDGSGWLRLAFPTDGVLGQVQANAKIASSVPIRLEFDYLQWGGRFDGMSIYFADASAAFAGQGGEPGGALGYCGMAGAYLGIALDEGGNFSRWHCAIGKFSPEGIASTGTPGHNNAAAVRGPRSNNYPYVTSVSLQDSHDICSTCTDRNQVGQASTRHVVLDMVPRVPASSGYVLNMTVNDREVLKNVDFPYAPPAELMMGLAATTGAAGAYHEIRNVKVNVQGRVTAVNCLNGVGPNGRCLPVNNALKTWDIFANVGSFRGGKAPPQLVDGDLAQTGWDGTAPWTSVTPTLSPGVCMQVGPQMLPDWLPGGGPGRANQIVIVSRQDDWMNAIDPAESTEFTRYGAVDFRVEYSTDRAASYKLAPGGDVKGNNKVMRVFDLPQTELITNVSVVICKTADNNSSPLTEILVWEKK